MSTHHAVYGMRTLSEVDLPDWPTIEPAAPPDLVIRRTVLDGPAVDGQPHMARSVTDADHFRLGVQGVGRFRATGGTLIEVDADAGAAAPDVLLYLMGAVMAAVLHQRRVFPLHASSVALGGEAVALAGESGAGKSTLVASLVAHGGDFLTDDVSVLQELPDGRFGVWPGATRAKLDHASLATLGKGFSVLDPAGGTRGKYHLPLSRDTRPMTPVPLTRVYLLADSEGPVRMERLSGLEAVAALVEETYFLSYASALGAAESCFRMAGSLAQTVQVRRLLRPRDIGRLPEIVAAIEAADGNT